MNQHLQPNPRFAELTSDESVERASRALAANGFTVFVVNTGREAHSKTLELIPEGAQVMTMTSVTLDSIGLSAVLDESGKYDAIRPKLMKLDWKTQADEMRRLAAAPDVVIGSIHAVTEDGHVMIASNTGSQLAAYAYTGGKVIWVVGTQKIVQNDAEAFRRIDEYALPLEDERAQKAYGVRSGVNKVLVIRKEVRPQRITIILVKERLGF